MFIGQGNYVNLLPVCTRSPKYYILGGYRKIGRLGIPKHVPLDREKATGVSLVNPNDTSAPYLMRNFLLAPMMCVNNVQPFSVALSPLLSRGHLN